MTEWLKSNVDIGPIVAMIAAFIAAFVALWNTHKQLRQQRKQFQQQQQLALQQLEQQRDQFERHQRLQREELEKRALAYEEKHNQTIQAFVDYLSDVRSLNKPPAPSGVKLWEVAYRRLHEVRRRLTETLSLLPGDHVARQQLGQLLEAFHAWADKWDELGEFAGTLTGEQELMSALSALQTARWKAEDELRRTLGVDRHNSG